jgi:hypothetical protein
MLLSNSLDNVTRLSNRVNMKTWTEIEKEYAGKGKHHCLRLTCSKCGNGQTCRCKNPKTEEIGICPDCAVVGEDINPDLKRFFYHLDDFCKSHGIFPDNVDDQRFEQGYKIPVKNRDEVMAFLEPHAQRLGIIINVAEHPEKSGGTTLFTFKKAAINDYWTLKTGKSMSPFVNKQDEKDVRAGKTLCQAGYKSKFKILHEMEPSDPGKQFEPDTNWTAGTTAAAADVQGITTGANETNPHSDEIEKKRVGLRTYKSGIANKKSRLNAYDNPKVPPKLCAFERNLDTLLERGTTFRISQGHVDQPENQPGADTTKANNSKVPNPSHLPDEPIPVPIIDEPVESEEEKTVVVYPDEFPGDLGEPFRGCAGMGGRRTKMGGAPTAPGSNRVVPKPPGGLGSLTAEPQAVSTQPHAPFKKELIPPAAKRYKPLPGTAGR